MMNVPKAMRGVNSAMKNPLFQSAAQWPVFGEYDVVVVGAGPAGIGASIAAARQGMRTILVERYGAPGGVASNCSVPLLMGFHCAAPDGHGALRNRQILYGIAEEVARNLDRIGQARFRIRESKLCEDLPLADRPLLHDVFTSVHSMRVVYNQMLEESCVTPLYYASVLGGVLQNGRLEAVAVDLLEGPALIRGKCFVDCTGDAHLLWRCGAPTRAFTNEESMVKSVFADVRVEHLHNLSEVRELFERYCAEGKCPLVDQYHYFGGSMLDPMDIQLNLTLAEGSALSSVEMTRMDIELRRQVSAVTEWLKTSIPVFAGSHITDTSFVVGVRGGRAILGEETIDERAIANGFAKDESVLLATKSYGSPHHVKDKIDAARGAWGLEKGVYHVPYGALIPQGIDNAFCAGRAISATGRVYSTIRLMPSCMGTGQAAGTAAALCVQKGLRAKDLPYPELKKALTAQNVVVDENDLPEAIA